MLDRIRQLYRALHPAGRLGFWGSIAMVAVILLYFTRTESWREDRVDPDALPGIAVVATSEQVNTLRLGAAPGHADELDEQFRPVSEPIRSRVVQRLGEFRARYKQQWPTITVQTAPGDETARRIAGALNQMLARFGLNGPVETHDPDEPSPAGQPLVLWWSADDLPLAYALLSAIAPYIQGEVAVIKDPSLSANEARLRIGGQAFFTGDGAVMLGRAG